MGIEGRMEITLQRHGGRVTQVCIAAVRPLQAVRVFRDKTPAQLLETLPLLYGICGMAHTQAALLACARAAGGAPPADLQHALTLLVEMETAREHLWRVLMDWPRHLGEQAPAGAAVLGELLPRSRAALFPQGLLAGGAWCRAELESCSAALEEALTAQVFGCPPAAWAALEPAAWRQWVRDGDSVAARLLGTVLERGWAAEGEGVVRCLPVLDEAALQQRLAGPAAEDFVARPTWAGHCRETTPLCRQHDHPLLQALRAGRRDGLLGRLVALLLELALIPARLRRLAGRLPARIAAWPGAAATGEGRGLGQVEAARGRLIHYVELAGGQVRRFRIVAPTEWNFHPEGVVAAGLRRLAAGDADDVRRQAALFIGAVDPCVACELRIH